MREVVDDLQKHANIVTILARGIFFISSTLIMSTTELELQSYTAAAHLEEQNGSAGKDSTIAKAENISTSIQARHAYGQRLGNVPVEQVEAEVSLKRWNESNTMVFRVLTSFWCMVVLGLNDGQIGAIIPYVSLSTSLTCTENN